MIHQTIMQASIVLHPQASLDIYIYSLIAYHIGVQINIQLIEKEKREKSTNIARVIDVWRLIIRTKNSNPVNYILWLRYSEYLNPW